MPGKSVIALVVLIGWGLAAAAQSPGPKPATSQATDDRKCLIAQRAYKPLDPRAVAIAAVPCKTVSGPSVSRYKTERYLAEFADCVVRQRSNRPKVDQFLRIIPGSAAFGPAGLAATDMTCLNDAARRSGAMLTMRMRPTAFREALYPALYRREFGKTGPVATITDLPPLSLATEFDGPSQALPGEYRPRRALGDCVARAQPGGAHAFLLAKPQTSAENGAVEQLKPALGSCLSEGLTVRLSRSALRAYVGEAQYKLSRAASARAVAAALEPDRGGGDARH